MADLGPWRAHAVMLFVIIAWAGSFSFISIALKELPVPDVALLRFIVAAIPFALVLAWKGVPRLDRQDWAKIALVGIIGVGGFQLALVHGQTGVSPGATALVVATSPVWGLLLARADLGERMNKRKITGVGLALFGVALVLLGRGEGFDVAYLQAMFVIILVPIFNALSSVEAKHLTGKCDPLSLTALLVLVGSFPLVLFAEPGMVARFASASRATWVAIIFLGIPATFLAYAGFFYALGQLQATATLAYVYLQPLFAFIWAFVLVGEAITPLLIGGAGLVVAGVVLTNAPKVRRHGHGHDRRAGSHTDG